jgi:hypothetical protein
MLYNIFSKWTIDSFLLKKISKCKMNILHEIYESANIFRVHIFSFNRNWTS